MTESIVFECEKGASPDCWGLLYLSEDSDMEFLKDWKHSEDYSLTYCLICPECAKNEASKS